MSTAVTADTADGPSALGLNRNPSPSARKHRCRVTLFVLAPIVLRNDRTSNIMYIHGEPAVKRLKIKYKKYSFAGIANFIRIYTIPINNKNTIITAIARSIGFTFFLLLFT